MQFPNLEAIHRTRVQLAFDTICAAIHRAVVRHNGNSRLLLEVHSAPTRMEVFQRGLIFPSFTLLFDTETCELLYHAPSRCADANADRGAIVPGYNGNLLWVNAAGITHRAAPEQLIDGLLMTAMSSPRVREAQHRAKTHQEIGTVPHTN